MVLVWLSIEFFVYDFVDDSILKVDISNTKMPINLVCIYRSPVSISDNSMNSLIKVMDDFKLNSAITVFTDDMIIIIIGIQENNKYLFSESQFISFKHFYTRLPKGIITCIIKRVWTIYIYTY
jgi:hypothetical protein